MHIRFLVLPLIVAGCLLAACQQSDTSAQPTLAVVDLARVMRDSEPGKEGVKFLEGLQNEVQSKLNVVQKKLEENPKDEAAQKEMQNIYVSAQQRLQAEQQNVVNVLYDVVQRTLNAYRVKKGYAVILGTEAALSFDSKIDVTKDILEAVNGQKVDFKPVIPENDKKSESGVQGSAADDTAKANAPATPSDAATPNTAETDTKGSDGKEATPGDKK